jgi:hypothetical protein
MDDKIPCCQLDAARRVRQVQIDGTMVGIAQLNEIFKLIYSKKMDNKNDIQYELLRQVKIYNYVPSSAERMYQEAIYTAYLEYEKELGGD